MEPTIHISLSKTIKAGLDITQRHAQDIRPHTHLIPLTIVQHATSHSDSQEAAN